MMFCQMREIRSMMSARPSAIFFCLSQIDLLPNKSIQPTQETSGIYCCSPMEQKERIMMPTRGLEDCEEIYIYARFILTSRLTLQGIQDGKDYNLACLWIGPSKSTRYASTTVKHTDPVNIWSGVLLVNCKLFQLIELISSYLEDAEVIKVKMIRRRQWNKLLAVEIKYNKFHRQWRDFF